MEVQAVSPRMQLVLLLLLDLIIGSLLWLIWRDRPNGVLQTMAEVGAVLAYLPPIFHLYYKFRTRGPQRWRWQIPDSVGFVLGWIGFLMRQEAAAENSWLLSNRGSIFEICGGLAIVYAFLLLFMIPKDQR